MPPRPTPQEPSSLRWQRACKRAAGGTCTLKPDLGLTLPQADSRLQPRCTRRNKWQTILQTIHSDSQIPSWEEVSICFKTLTSRCCRLLSPGPLTFLPPLQHHRVYLQHNGHRGDTPAGPPVTARTAKKPNVSDPPELTLENETFTVVTFRGVARSTERLLI